MKLRQNIIAEDGRYAVPDEGASQRSRFIRPLRTMAIIAGACIFCFQMVNTLHAQSFVNRTKSLQFTTTQEILQYTREENYVRFAFRSKPISSAPLSISLQGMNAESGRWQSIATVKRPSSKVTRMKIPLGWQKADLRVVAYYPSSKVGRIQIPSVLDPAERTVTFSSRRGAQLYSIEARPNAKSAWSRVSTLAATPSTSQHRAQIPSSIAAGWQVRVVAVLGTTTTLPASLVSSLPTAMRDGPSRFSAENNITSAPLLSRDGLLTSTPLSSNPAITANMVQESDIWKIRGKNIYFLTDLGGCK